MARSLLVTVLLLVCCDSSAQWQPATGPEGGRGVRVVAIDPLDAASVYAGGRLLWHSADGGTTWARVENVPLQPHDWVFSMAISRDEDGPILVWATRLLVSLDRGATWAVSEATLSAFARGGIQFGPAGSGVVYCGDYNGIRRSNDSGKRWEVLTTVPKEVRAIEHFVADRFDAETISFMHRSEDGKTFLALSRDGGTSFKNVPFPEGEEFAASVSTDPDDKTMLHLCTQTNGWGRGHERRYYYSYDDGASWELLWDPPVDGEPDVATRRKLRQVFPDVIPTPVPVWGRTMLNRCDVAWSENEPGRVVGTFDGRVLRSDDFGKSWELSMEGLIATRIWRIAFDPRDPKAAYCAETNHLWRTIDHGRTWAELPAGDNHEIASMTFSPDGKYLLVLADGIQRGGGGGRDWEKVWESDDYRKRLFVLYSYEAQDETGAARHVCVAIGNGFCLDSIDGGATWRDAGETDFKLQPYGRVMWPFAQRVVGESELWFVRDQRDQILSSSDRGRTWEPYAPIGQLRPSDWAFAADGTLWMVHDRKLASLSQGDDSTKTFDLPNGMGAMALACDPEDARTVYVALTDGRMLRTTDAGGTFTLLEGGPRGLETLTMAVSPHDGALWVGTDSNGVWILDNPKTHPAAPPDETEE
jgi:photosystem II stability/assembly factor-like uncharacterized protein